MPVLGIRVSVSGLVPYGAGVRTYTGLEARLDPSGVRRTPRTFLEKPWFMTHPFLALRDRPLELNNGEVTDEVKTLFTGADPESYITEYAWVHKENLND